MVTCTKCHQDLPESEFYPSSLQRGQHHCKKCAYEHYQKKAIKKYQESLANLVETDFDRFYGGYNIKVLNYARPNEYKYIISSTAGETFNTNDFDSFLEKLWQELRPEK